MSLINEEHLRSALAAAGHGIEPPSDGPTRIVAAATRSSAPREADVERTPSMPRSWQARNVVAVAAASFVVAAVAFTTIGFSLQRNDAPRTALLPPIAVLGHGHGTEFTDTKGVTLGLPRAGATLSNHRLSGSASHSTANSGTQQLASKIVSTGRVSLTVTSGTLKALLTRLNNLAVADGGFISSSSVVAGAGNDASRSTGSVTVRVPQPRFGGIVSQVQRLGRATAVVTNSTDVTSEYVDYQSQISALEASRAQYLSIMTKATTIGQILQVQAQLNTIETEIQQLEGQRNVLDNQAAYGTLTVLLNPGLQPTRAAAESGFSRAVHNSVGGFVAGFEGLVAAVGPGIFGLLCLFVLLVAGRSVWRATRRRML
jgi:hypothetical protein